MKYEEIAKAVESLSYRDKFRLAQLLIQLGRKQEEEEEEYPQQRPTTGSNSPELTTYVAERINKLRPTKKDGLINSINAMFQFQGGISDADRNKIIEALQKKKIISISETGKVSYNE